MIYSKTIQTPIGELGLYADEKHLLRITFCAAGENVKSNKIIETTEKQLQEYFAGKLKEFTVPLKMEGTEFRKPSGINYRRFLMGKLFLIRNWQSESEA